MSEPKKPDLRRELWQALRDAGGARFPGALGRIPNFKGAEAAAERLAEAPVWRHARVLLCNPDLPQRPVRHRALRAGKRVITFAPRLAGDVPFRLLDPELIDPRRLWRASSLAGGLELGQALDPGDLPAVELAVLGCVGAASDGARLGRGDGAVDLAFALLRRARRLTGDTPVTTTAHPVQLTRRGRIPMEPHDLGVDQIFLPAKSIRCPHLHERPAGLLPRLLDEERLAATPVLRTARPRRAKA